LKLFEEWGKRDKGELWSGGNSSMIYLIHCKNLYKYHNVPPLSTTIKGKKKNRKEIYYIL
jgi:hypothetical protein